MTSGGPNGSDHPGEADDVLLERLRELQGELHDPVPPHVLAAARAALGSREPGAELARLTEDAALPGRASASGPRRRLRFEAATLAVQLEVSEAAGRWRVAGRLSPAQPAAVDVRRTDRTERVEVDRRGRFAVEGPPGPVSFTVRLERGDHTVATEWVVL
jgi:hypothetical protein